MVEARSTCCCHDVPFTFIGVSSSSFHDWLKASAQDGNHNTSH